MVWCLLEVGCQPGAAAWAGAGLAVEKVFMPPKHPVLLVTQLNTVLT